MVRYTLGYPSVLHHLYTSYPPKFVTSAVRTIKQRNAVALTFDDGPHPEATPRALKALLERNIKATFFVIGERSRKYPELLQRIVQEGHTIGSHGQRHVRHFGSQSFVEQSISASLDTIREQAGIQPAFFRPPYGWWRSAHNPILGKHHLQLVLWSLMPGDYLSGVTPAQIGKVLARRLQEGDIVVYHDNIATWEHIEDTIHVFADLIHERGLNAVPLGKGLES